MQYDFTKIPIELQNLNSWLLWHRFPQADGTIKKVPDEFSRNKATWETIRLLSLTEAKTKLYSPSSLSDGIGIAFTKTNNIAGIDIDDAIHPDGSYNEKVRQIILPVLAQARKDGCYIEKSISGTGYHIYGYTNLKPTLIKTSGTGKIVSRNLEIYYADSYFTVSGNTLNAGFGNIDNAIQIAFQIIRNQNIMEVAASMENKKDTITQPKEEPPKNTDEFSDSDVLQLPSLTIDKTIDLMSKDEVNNGAKAYYLLQNGYDETNKHLNKSEVDMFVIGVLCYWLYRYGAAEICNVLEKSKLYRPDEKTKNYLYDSVEKAYNNAEKFFPAVNYKRLSKEQQIKLKTWVRKKSRF